MVALPAATGLPMARMGLLPDGQSLSFGFAYAAAQFVLIALLSVGPMPGRRLLYGEYLVEAGDLQHLPDSSTAIHQRHSLALREKKPAVAGFFVAISHVLKKLLRLNVRGLLAFLTCDNVERDALAFFQGFEARTGDCREMREKVFATSVRRNKAKAFTIIEPFHCA